jgi:eukaryotic-like serine/threonine-protein kinase
MARELAPDAVKPDTADLAYNIEASTAAYGGQMAKAADLAQRAADVAKHADQKDAAAGYLAINAVHEALAGETELAKQHATAAGALSSQREVQAVTALAWALSGDTHQATQVATDLSDRYPEDTWVQLIHLPTIRGAVALQEGNGAKAVEALAPAAPYELGRGDVIWLYPVFVRAQAYLAARQSTAAVAEFQSLLDHPGLVLNDPIGALAHLGLARAYAQSGDTAKAKTAYQDFLALWKDADPQLPLLQQAQLEYSRLP